MKTGLSIALGLFAHKLLCLWFKGQLVLMSIWPGALEAGRVKNALQSLAIMQVEVVSQLHLHWFITCKIY